jgi:hypothetical protein
MPDLERVPRVRLLAGYRQPDETRKAAMACNDYLRMGRSRTLRKVIEMYEAQVRAAEKNGQVGADVPTLSKKTIQAWSARFGWIERSAAYDAIQEERRTAMSEEVMRSGMAQAHERVYTLDQLSKRILSALDSRGLYGTTIKGIGGGKSLTIVEEEVFRESEIRQLRGLLDDIAREVGGREKRIGLEVTGLAGLLSNSAAFDDDVEDAEWEDVDVDPLDGTDPDLDDSDPDLDDSEPEDTAQDRDASQEWDEPDEPER